MDSLVGFWILVILTSLIIAGGLIFLSYWIPKRFGKRKLGSILAIIVALLLVSPIVSFFLEDYLFFKSDAIQRLKEHEVVLQDNFDLQSNKITGIGDYYHRFVLNITLDDKERLIKFFKQLPCYRDSIPEGLNFRSNKPRYANGPVEYVVTYQNEHHYVLEYYKPNKPGHSIIWDKISIPKKGNQLIYERTMD